uniref:Pre-rRNA-processing protein TSR2 homolog n=1 Tax=Daphnia galeata TaxID=27404 RepID=A0A8J2RCI8_9CRUS|nr:unnamed protein product [Daphnia galeata]
MSLFSTVVQTLFNNWTALQLAVEHQLGGTQSKEIAKWMMTVVENFFLENDDVLAQEITEYMEDLMNNEFNTLCEDGSLEEMGESLCKYFRLIKDGKDAEVILELQKYKGSSVHLCKTASNHESIEQEKKNEESSDHQTVDSETPKKSTKNEPDEDGWVTVTKGKKH